MTNNVMTIPPPAAPLRSAAGYNIDSAHSSAHFSVRHMMVSNVRGQFSKVRGTISFEDSNPSAIRVDAVIDVTTVDTREPDRDNHLKSSDFFDVEKFPAITFKSKSAKKTAGGLALTGDLTIHGVTREVTLDVDGLTPEIKDLQGLLRRGATATTRINRKDFGLLWNHLLDSGGVVIGDDISITIDIEATRAAD
jgi:polyisoprenoid-binding protein YceI